LCSSELSGGFLCNLYETKFSPVVILFTPSVPTNTLKKLKNKILAKTKEKTKNKQEKKRNIHDHQRMPEDARCYKGVVEGER